MAVSDGQTTAQEMKMRLREKPLSQLMEEMEKLSSSPDCDIDLLCAYLDVLDEKDPVLPPDFDPAAQYEKFKENHADLFALLEEPTEKPAPRKNRFPRVKKALVAFAAIFCVVIMAADASGAGIINRLIEWGTETFSLRPVSGVMELAVAEENGFKSMAEALEYYGVENPAIPTWIPNRYSINKVMVITTEDTIIVSGRYTSDDDVLLMRVTIGFEEDFTFEENQVNNHNFYESAGITYILSTNITDRRAAWETNGSTYSIAGIITKHELKEMLDSIQIAIPIEE